MQNKEDIFRHRLASVLSDLHSDGSKDAETMYLLGGLADAIMQRAEAKRWHDVKSAMTENDYNTMLETFDRRGNAFYKEGQMKHAYCIQALATSVVAYTQWDPEIREGERLLDEVIDRAVAFYRKQPKPSPQ